MIAAFDIGGPHVAGARVDLGAGAVVRESRCRLSLPPDGTREHLVAGLVRAASAVASAEVTACGITAPGPFEYEHGVSRIRGKLDGLYGVDLRRELARTLGVEMRFLNDAHAFLLGEWWAGAADDAPLLGAALYTALP